jgi:superfamily II DNA or RNA helicase
MTRLRDYQQRAVEHVFKEWEDVRSTLVVQPTGTGKTTVFTDIVRRMQPERAIIVAHREELIFQAKARIEDQAGLDCQIEMADSSASLHDIFRTPVIVASVQTLISGVGDNRRMNRFSPHDFGLLVIDEGHHSTAASYRKVIEHFSKNPDLKILGVTATPDRADEEALGQIFETVADVYEILDAIHDGWLVPIDQQMVNVEDLDFSGIHTVAGDLNSGELAAVMESEKILQGVCGATIDIVGHRQTILFAASVVHAEMACNILNRNREHMADWISGKTPKEERRKTMKRFHEGELQVLCNVGCLTEGVDVPAAEVVVMGRPTKSRSLYAQMAGRILRPLPGLVDHLDTGDDRKAAIRESAKPGALIIDFVGNSGRHKLVTSADILGGNVSEEAIELAVRKARESGRPVRMSDELDEAEEEIRIAREAREKRQAEMESRKSYLVAKVKYQKQHVDPFRAFGLMPARERGWDIGKMLSLKQRAVLLKIGVDPDMLSYGAARQLLNEQFRRWRLKLCTAKQANVLRKFGYEPKDMTMVEAGELLDKLARNNWRKVA